VARTKAVVNGTGRIFELSGTGHRTVTAQASLDANFRYTAAGLGTKAAGNLYAIFVVAVPEPFYCLLPGLVAASLCRRRWIRPANLVRP
jgi:hypothetical protein